MSKVKFKQVQIIKKGHRLVSLKDIDTEWPPMTAKCSAAVFLGKKQFSSSNLAKPVTNIIFHDVR